MDITYSHTSAMPMLLLAALASAVLYAGVNIPLPGLHDLPIPRIGHHEGTRLQHEMQGKEIINNVKNPCKHFECASSPDRLLRVCTEGLITALQWMWHDGTSWYEGTTFVQKRQQKVPNYLRNNGCKEIINVSD